MIAALMHQLVLRVLLLAVFFNTAIGMPLHAAGHMQGHGHLDGHLHGHLHAGEDTGHCDDAAAAQPEEHAEAHAQCVWCPAQAQLGMALASAPHTPLPQLALPAAFNATTATVWLPQPERWRFAARDPPSMS